MKILMLFAFVAVAIASMAQDDFSRKDSLMGYLYPERQYDVHYYELDVEVNPLDSTVSGSVKMAFTAEAELQVLQFDLFENMTALSVVYQNKPLEFNREYNAVFVEMPEPLEKGETAELNIRYRGKPVAAKNAPWDGGFVWQKDRDGNDWIGVAVQGDGAALFWPNKDHITDEPDSMLIHCKVPNELTCVVNGKLIATDFIYDTASTGEPTVIDEWSKWSWKVSNPINNYNVSLNIANYTHISDHYISKIDGDTLPLDYYVLPHNEQKAREQFKEVKTRLDCFVPMVGEEGGFCFIPAQGDGRAPVQQLFAQGSEVFADRLGHQVVAKGYLRGGVGGCGEQAALESVFEGG